MTGFRIARAPRAALSAPTVRTLHIARDLARAALQHFLPAARDGHEPALPRPFGLEAAPLELHRHLPREEVRQRRARGAPAAKPFGKARRRIGHLHAQTGRRCERIPLHMVDEQAEIREPVRARQRLVRRIPPPIQPPQSPAQFLCRFHGHQPPSHRRSV